MNYDDVMTFISVCEHGNISKASQELYVSQSTVSQRIMNLEQDLNIVLLHRKQGHREVTLTPAGKHFLSLAEQYVTLSKEMRDVKNVDLFQQIRLGCVDIINRYTFFDFYNQLINSKKNFHLQVKTHHSDEIYGLLKNKFIDMGFVYTKYPTKEIDSIPLYNEPICLISASKSKYPHYVNIEVLDRKDNIFLNWNPDFLHWYSNIWNMNIVPYVTVNTGNLLPGYLVNIVDSWAFAPYTVCVAMQKEYDIQIHSLDNEPPHQICYQLISSTLNDYQKEFFASFQKELVCYLKTIDQVEISSDSFEATIK